MKPSKLLRKAINTKLSSTILGYKPENKSRYICNALELLWTPELHGMIRDVQALVQNNLPNANSPINIHCRHDNLHGDEIQQIRYMYADFLAYSLEDEGL